jgi:hypothetical protein
MSYFLKRIHQLIVIHCGINGFLSSNEGYCLILSRKYE